MSNPRTPPQASDEPTLLEWLGQKIPARLIAFVALVIVVGVSGLLIRSEGDRVTSDDLAAVRAHWEEAGIDDYSFTYQFYDSYSPGAAFVTVRNGEVAAAHSPLGFLVNPAGPFLTMDDYFDEIDRALGVYDGSRSETELTLHPEYGFPDSFDVYIGPTGHGLRARIRHFAPGLSAGSDEDVAALATARETWVASDITNYELTYKFSNGVPQHVSVRDGEIAATRIGPQGQATAAYFTMDEIIDRFQERVGGGYLIGESAWDERFGIPTKLMVTLPYTDTEAGHFVSNHLRFQILEFETIDR